jgi:hypothetical protein
VTCGKEALGVAFSQTCNISFKEDGKGQGPSLPFASEVTGFPKYPQ